MAKVEGPTSLWTADPPAVWFDETVGQVLARQAAATPDAPAVHWMGDDDTLVTWTYGDLHARVSERGDRAARVGRPGRVRRGVRAELARVGRRLLRRRAGRCDLRAA